jgi:hypothetical protein
MTASDGHNSNHSIKILKSVIIYPLHSKIQYKFIMGVCLLRFKKHQID